MWLNSSTQICPILSLACVSVGGRNGLFVWSWCFAVFAFHRYLLVFFWSYFLSGFRPSLSMGEQLHWSEELSPFLPLPAVAYHPYHERVWLRPGLCPAPPPAAEHTPRCCHVSFTWLTAGQIMRLPFPFYFCCDFFLLCAAFVVISLTISSQYGCNVCGWSVFCPSRWSDWVPHSVSGPR